MAAAAMTATGSQTGDGGAPAFGVTARAAKRIGEVLAAENDPTQVLRVSVSGGGCSGFQYHFDFDTAVNEEDTVIERDGVRVVVDEMSLDLLRGGELDYVEELVGSYFAVMNPNATSSCGCGSSFSI